MLVIREDEVSALLTIGQAVDLLETAFGTQDGGQATNRPRVRVRLPESLGTLHMLGAALATEDVFGFKAYASTRGGVRFMVVLFDAQSGVLKCMIEANRLGQIRTGAATGVATRYMAWQDADSVGIYGSGYQAESQLEAVCAVRPVRTAVVYSRAEVRRQAFADRMSARLGIQVMAEAHPEAVAAAHILVTATSARQPVLLGDWLQPGTHVNAMGANQLMNRELDDAVVRRASAVVVDSLEQALGEAGDIVGPLERGILVRERIWELHEVVSGARLARTSPGDITLFKSLGIGLEDIAVGNWVYRQAVEQGAGERVHFLE